ncbi:MAG: hypothetical protein DMG14_13200 [Acidobacteria bacterium]|nr:MAG: hypothetical protein DMG14_13200 [Acidobacteriota bacterium]
MKEREYLRLKRQIENEYRQKIEALELIWKMAGKSPGRPERLPRLAVQQLVRAFLDQSRDDDFSLDEVFKYLRQTAPNVAVNRGSLSRVLQRLVLNGELELVSRGRGNKPSRYRRAEGAPKAA